MISVREAREQDDSQIRDVFVATYAEGVRYGFLRTTARHSNYLIAREGGHVVGAVGFTLAEHDRTVLIFELISLISASSSTEISPKDFRANCGATDQYWTNVDQ